MYTIKQVEFKTNSSRIHAQIGGWLCLEILSCSGDVKYRQMTPMHLHLPIIYILCPWRHIRRISRQPSLEFICLCVNLSPVTAEGAIHYLQAFLQETDEVRREMPIRNELTNSEHLEGKIPRQGSQGPGLPLLFECSILLATRKRKLNNTGTANK